VAKAENNCEIPIDKKQEILAFKASDSYRNYALGILVVVLVCSWIDRNIFSMLLQAIKVDFHLSDTQLGLLGGVAFGLFYATLGIPIARLADTWNRRTLISIALCLWSLMTALSGFTTGFLTLFLARIGVGVGEAGAAPSAQTLVADYFSPEKRGNAMGRLSLYIPIGFLVSFLLGGWINEFFGWRKAFMGVGIPGILVAILIRMTLREPPRGLSENISDIGRTPPLFSTLRYLLSRPSIRHISFAGAIHGIGAWAMGVWLPSYFMRIHKMGSGEVGTWMALIYGLGGGIGALTGGYWADRIVKKTGDERWYLWGSGIAIMIFVPFAFFIFLSSTAVPAFIALIIPIIAMHMYPGPVMAMIQGLAGLRRRAVAAAFYLFLANLVSMGLGPVLVGMVSDYFSSQYGNESLRYALLTIIVVSFPWAALHFFIAGRTLKADLAFAREKPI
jgi:predicted MFS family arabinose efflux permease